MVLFRFNENIKIMSAEKFNIVINNQYIYPVVLKSKI